MKRHVQFTGIRNWYGADLLDLQAEGLKVLDKFLSQYGSYVVSGCEIAQNGQRFDISPGLVALAGTDPDGMPVNIVAPFDGAFDKALPLYLTLSCEVVQDQYEDGSTKPITHNYKAAMTSLRPESGPYIEIDLQGTRRFTDAMQDEAHRFVTDAQRTAWDNKVDKAEGKGLSSNDFTTDEKNKLAGVEAGANNYVHPDGPQVRHVTDGQIAGWDAAAAMGMATQEEGGYMSAGDKTKLDGVEAGANNYVHPYNSSTRHVTDSQIAKWNAAGGVGVVTQSNNGLMSSSDKRKLDGIDSYANYYVHPDNSSTRHVSDSQISTWNAKESTSGAQTKADSALASAKTYADSIKTALLDGAPENLDTLKKLATAIGSNPTFNSWVSTQLAGKANSDLSNVTISKSFSTNGYIKMPGGIMIQWGYLSYISAAQAVRFPLTFTSAYSISVTAVDPSSSDAGRGAFLVKDSLTTSGFTGKVRYGAQGVASDGFYWIAIGRY